MAAQLSTSFPKLSEAVRHNPKAAAELDALVDNIHSDYTKQLLYLQAIIAKLEEEKRLARAIQFAASSEQSPQYALFNEAEEV